MAYAFRFRQDIVAVLRETSEFNHSLRLAAVELVSEWEEEAYEKSKR